MTTTASNQTGRGRVDKHTTLDEAARLLREFQLVEWSLDRRITKKAVKEQRRIVKRITEALTGSEINEGDLDRVLGTMNWDVEEQLQSMTNQSPSDIHESTTCALGPDGGPCELCAWANASERQEMLKTIDRAVDTTTAEYARVATVACVRAAIADVLDAGDDSLLKWWSFYPDEGDNQTEHRMAFIDAVVGRITTLQAPPHNMDARLLELVKSDLGEMRRLTEARKERIE